MRAVLACLVVGGVLGLGALAVGGSLAGEVRGMVLGDESRPNVIGDRVPRVLMANEQEWRRLLATTAGVRVGLPQSLEVNEALNGLRPVKRQFDADPHYLLAAASHLRDVGALDEDYETADRLGIATGGAAMVLRRIAGSDERRIGNGTVLVRDFYPGAASDAQSEAFLLRALDVMRAAVTELRDGDVLVVLAR
jgi:hypothetical protein